MAKKLAKRPVETKRLKQITKRIWWATILSGITSIIFGLIAVCWPGLTLGAIIVIFGIFIIAIGVFWLSAALTQIKSHPLWWLMAVFGALVFGVGIYLLMNPETAARLIAVLLMIYIFAQSLLDLVTASYSQQSSKWLLIATGILGIILGFVVMFNPILATVALIWVLGLYALIRGAIATVYALMIRKKLKA